MCGISGYLDTDAGVSTEILRRMTEVIRHRGPDDEGYALIGPGGTGFFRGDDTMPDISLPPLEAGEAGSAVLGLAHRRLSILDLSASGHQPMDLSGQDVTVVYNGEIYNYLELRQELEAMGFQFRTTCDTEVLLNSYLAWGENCLDHFNGMWGFALWDGRARKLFCARDRLGAKPFHYWRQGNRMLFGSELKQLCQDDTVPRKFNLPYLAANLQYHLSDFNGHTLIKGFRLLPPGHKLVVSLSEDLRRVDSVRETAYWKLDTALREDLSHEEWLCRVAEEFSRSCRWRLRSDAPLAALLSGGLDSSCMVTELCSQLAEPSSLQTFTTSYPGRSTCDEWEFARMVNEHCGCRGNQILPDPGADIEKRFEKLVWHIEGMGGLPLLGPMLLYEEIHRRGFKVVLNGQCGDETMFGYERYYAFYFMDLVRRGKLGRVLREFRLASVHSKLSAWKLFQIFAYFNFPAVRNLRQRRRAGSYVRPDLLNAVDMEELRPLLYPRSLRELQYVELHDAQLTHIVRWDDRLYMASSLESRIPFMDYRYVEMAVQIPPAEKIRNGYTKSLMREVFDHRMPKAVTWRTNKMGFESPVREWASRFSREYLLDQIRSSRTASFFQRERLEDLVQAQAQPPGVVFDFLQVEQFARRFGVS